MPNQESGQSRHKGFLLRQTRHVTHETKNQADEEIMIIGWNRMRLKGAVMTKKGRTDLVINKGILSFFFS
jgi:hypothetical protein